MSASYRCGLLLVVGLLCCWPVLAQKSQAKLKEEKAELQKDIAYKEKLIEQAKKKSQLSSTEVVILGKKIAKREELIKTIKAEIRLLSNQIEEQQQLIEAMENDLQRLKDEYAKMIYHTYKNRNAYSRLMFIFSSENFNQAYKRLQYLRQYAAFRQHQGELIQKTRELLEDKKADLEAIRGEKEGLLQAEQGEIRSLGSERKQQQGTVRKLQKEQKKLKAQLRAAQRKAELLQREIERIIREELARKGKRGSTYDVDTPRARELSSNFTANKGKLPWPVKKGEITGYFGTHPHPILKGIDVKNSGVVISTVSGSKARAVFDGEVSRIIVLKGAGKTVMIRHGEFITIYTNLRDTYVKAGDKVTTEQEIGTLLDQKGTTEIEFQVWRGTDLQNPSLWLYKAR